MNHTHAVALVALGGFVGALTRYGVGLVLPDLVSTFTVNVAGCFALGYILYSARRDVISERVRVLVATGFLSSLTTYSTFAYDAYTASPVVALGYVGANYGVGFVAVAVGAYLADGAQREVSG